MIRIHPRPIATWLLLAELAFSAGLALGDYLAHRAWRRATDGLEEYP